MRTKTKRYSICEAPVVTPDGTSFSLWYIWDDDSKRVVKTHHMKSVIEAALELL